MKCGIVVAVMVAAGLISGAGLGAQAPAQRANPAQTQMPAGTPPASGPPPAGTQKPKAPTESNPFPEDTNNVPLMPNGNTPVTPDVAPDAAPAALPRADVDPVRSPDDPVGDAQTDAQGFSSSSTGLDNVMPPPDTDVGPKRGRKGRAAEPAPAEHQESAAEDEKVGAYYLDEKNWRAALSRYESAVVLDPENPDVYWGLGEAQRHLGKLAEAKAAYEKLVEYDPDSKHGKEARKILKSPEMASAPTASATKP